MESPTKQQLLHRIASIPAMEQGKLSAYTFPDRAGTSGPYHKLQHWQDGKNRTRYVSREELPQVQAALAGYRQYQELTTQYAQLVIDQTREAIAGSKKNASRPRSSSPRKRKSKD